MGYFMCGLFTESSSKIPGVPDKVRKQFKEMILREKDLAPAGDAQPAMDSNDDMTDNGSYILFVLSYLLS